MLGCDRRRGNVVLSVQCDRNRVGTDVCWSRHRHIEQSKRTTIRPQVVDPRIGIRYFVAGFKANEAYNNICLYSLVSQVP